MVVLSQQGDPGGLGMVALICIMHQPEGTSKTHRRIPPIKEPLTQILLEDSPLYFGTVLIIVRKFFLLSNWYQSWWLLPSSFCLLGPPSHDSWSNMRRQLSHSSWIFSSPGYFPYGILDTHLWMLSPLPIRAERDLSWSLKTYSLLTETTMTVSYICLVF